MPEDREIAAGTGITFEMLTGDLGQANYSSARVGLLEFRRRAEMLQRSLIEGQFLRPLWRRWRTPRRWPARSPEMPPNWPITGLSASSRRVGNGSIRGTKSRPKWPQSTPGSRAGKRWSLRAAGTLTNWTPSARATRPVKHKGTRHDDALPPGRGGAAERVHDERTVEAIVSTGADVPRGGYVERLDLRGADLSRLVGGPVLDAHRTATTSAQLGVIEAAELRPEGLWFRMKLRDSTAGRQVLTDIWDGTLRGLSIGYTVQKVADSREGDKRIRTATAWTPFEVSIVPVPADPGAHFRNGDSIMEQTTQEAEQQTADPDAAATRAQLNAEIRSIADTAGLARNWADEQIDAEATAEQARAAAFEAMRARSAQIQTRTTRATIGTDNTDPTVIATRAGEALFARAHPEHQMSDAARSFSGLTIPISPATACAEPAYRPRGSRSKGW